MAEKIPEYAKKYFANIKAEKDINTSTGALMGYKLDKSINLEPEEKYYCDLNEKINEAINTKQFGGLDALILQNNMDDADAMLRKILVLLQNQSLPQFDIPFDDIKYQDDANRYRTSADSYEQYVSYVLSHSKLKPLMQKQLEFFTKSDKRNSNSLPNVAKPA